MNKNDYEQVMGRRGPDVFRYTEPHYSFRCLKISRYDDSCLKTVSYYFKITKNIDKENGNGRGERSLVFVYG